jgi:hypothetical protein
MTDAHQELPPSPATTLAVALGVVVFGTLLVDYTRAWLLLIPLSFLLAAFTAGMLLHRFAAGSSTTDHPTMPQLAIQTGAGAAILSLCATLSALAGLLWLAGAATLVLDIAGIILISRTGRWSRPAHLLVPAASGMLLGLVWLVAWLWVTIPSTFFDELVYHLAIPERALATGSLKAFPWVHFTLMPHASDLLLAWGMAIGGDLGARAMYWSFWIWGSLAAWGLLDALMWPRLSRWTPALVAGSLASSPTLWFLGTLAFAETCLMAALLTAACVMATSEQYSRPWLPAGLLLGLAATVKLSGLAWVIAGLAAGIVLGWSLKNLALTALLALAGAAPWWARAAWFTGNPVYPLAYGWLGSGGLWNDTNQMLLVNDIPPSAAGLGPAGTLRLPWDLVMHSERFGSASDAGFLAVIATGMVLLLPILTRAAHAGPRMTRLGDAASVFVFIAGVAWAATTTTTRFFAPALLLSLVALLSLTLSFRKAGTTVTLAVTLLLGLWGTIRFLDQHETIFSSTQVALGREQRAGYLARKLDHYEATVFVQHRVPRDAKLLFVGESRPYYFLREAVAPHPLDRHPLTAWVQEADSPEALAKRLARERITHVVLNIREFERLHDKYGVLAFDGDRAQEYDDRLKRLPLALRQMFTHNHVYVFAVPEGT